MHPGTASRALDPNLPGRIAEPTATKVREAADALGYRPDPTARSLRTRRSGTVGIVLPDLTNPVLAPMVRAIEETLWAAGLACLVTDTDNRTDHEAALVTELVARRCEGLIVASAARTSRAVADLADTDLPVVLVTREPDGSGLPFVGADDATGVRSAVRHLVGLGHRRIGHLGGPEHLSTTVRRTRAFLDTCDDDDIRNPAVVHGPGFTIAGGVETMERMLADRPDVTAVIAGNDMMALGAYEVAERSGRRIPEDLSVVGHNDMPLMARVDPPLTTVSIRQELVGTTAAAMLLDLRAGGSPEPRRRLIETMLIERRSTAPPGTGRSRTPAGRPRMCDPLPP